jgi:hypothetical protein
LPHIAEETFNGISDLNGAVLGSRKLDAISNGVESRLCVRKVVFVKVVDGSIAYQLVNGVGGGIGEVGIEATPFPTAVKQVLAESSNTPRGVSMTAQFWRSVDVGDADDPPDRTRGGE